MKKFTVSQFLTAILMVITGFTLYSCSVDGPEIRPVKLEDVNGDYKGRLITIQGDNRTEKIKNFKAKKDTIMFSEFPVDEIVKTVVKDPVKAEEAIKAIGKVKYEIKYTASVNAANNVVELSFAPTPLVIQIPVDGVTKKTEVGLIAKQKGFYVGMDGSLRFALTAEKITVDGTILAPYEAISYNFPFCVKY
ncbi:DUF4840 domain-containing protein [Chryseobacterium jejuense]|uniref:DUF4840 domain-containing protein n=1 Tax=Chryseobacterium jejuense TaxID=445960 RepID=A0A2X2X2X5_CHRJE|nr:DUF4840 domain-containing protein [Chryseobacterium jejuense]SDI64376.1 protein of unknown function [Chryseobacterium jejuense]SQB47316.1 Uncharacterised protein [Chryseobacterium jejuense]